MKMPLSEHLVEMLSSKCQLEPVERVLLGVSGGADSLALMDLLWELGYDVVVAHLDHGLREDSAHQALAVKQLAQERNLIFVTDRVELASGSLGAVEERAREARYEFLFHQAQQHNAKAVMVAHTANDQVETLLMHLLRGAGLDGLAGMSFRSLPNPWSQRVPLLRPLLGVWRDEIEAYLTKKDLQPLVDISNQDTTYFRNRLRHHLLPVLDDYVPNVKQRLWQTAELLSADQEVLVTDTALAWRVVLKAQGPGYLALNREALLARPLGLRRRLVRRAVAKLRPTARDIDYALVERVLSFCQQPSQSRHMDVGLGLSAWSEQDCLYLAFRETDLPVTIWPQTNGEYSILLPGALDLFNGWRLVADLQPLTEKLLDQVRSNADPNRAWLDLGEVPPPLLMVRPRYPGDRFQPLGMGGNSLKVSDFMVNQKVPRRVRSAWPLICHVGQIVWIPGLRLAEPFRIRPASQVAVRLCLLPPKQ